MPWPTFTVTVTAGVEFICWGCGGSSGGEEKVGNRCFRKLNKARPEGTRKMVILKRPCRRVSVLIGALHSSSPADDDPQGHLRLSAVMGKDQ